MPFADLSPPVPANAIVVISEIILRSSQKSNPEHKEGCTSTLARAFCGKLGTNAPTKESA